MNPCPPHRNLLACVRGQLAPADREALEPHLAACASCRQVIEQALEEPEVLQWRQLLHINSKGDPARASRLADVSDDVVQQWRANLARRAASLPETEDTEQIEHSPSVPTPEGTARWDAPVDSATADSSSVRPQPTHRHMGRYRIERELGHGGMGVVYLGYDSVLKRHAAVKMLLAMSHHRPERRQRFLHEAEAVARLHHPNIVQVYEVGEEAGEPFLAMEFVDGKSLHDISRHTPQPPREAAELLRTLALAVHHAHQNGIIHRDLKPANVLLMFSRAPKARALEEEGRAFGPWLNNSVPKIVDFGLAKQLTDTPASLTGSNDMLGTPDYMAPEQAAGDRKLVGPASDVYALGAILYELLTGRPPFRGPTPMETLIQVRVNDPVPPRRLQPGLPRDLETICLKCLDKEPHRRYASAADLATDLTNYLDGQPISARRITVAGRLFRWCRRNPLVAGLSAALLLGCLVVGDLLLWQGRQRAVTQAQTDQQVRDALAEAERLGELAETTKDETILRSRERAAVERAAALAAVGDASPDLATRIRDLLALLDRDDADHRLAARLDQLLIDTYDSPTKMADRSAGFHRAMAEYGLAGFLVQPEAFSQRLCGARPRIRLTLLGILDRWAGSLPTAEQEGVYRTLEIADTEPWRCAVRRARRAGDQEALRRLAAEADVERQPPLGLIALGRALSYAERLALLHRARDRHADDFWLNMELMVASFGAKPRRTEDVLRFGTVAVSLRDNPPCQLTMGSIFTDLGRFDDAEAAYRRAIALQPTYQGAYYNLANLLEKQKRYLDAETLLRQGITHCPRYAELHSTLGSVLRRTGRPAEAEAALRHTLTLKPDHAFAFELLIILCREQKRYDDALAFVQQALQQHPDKYWPWMYQGKVLGNLGRWSEAAAAFSTAVALRPDDVQLRKEHDQARTKAAGQPGGISPDGDAARKEGKRFKPD